MFFFVWMSMYRVCAVPTEPRRKKALVPLELELQKVKNCHAGAEN